MEVGDSILFKDSFQRKHMSFTSSGIAISTLEEQTLSPGREKHLFTKQTHPIKI